MRRIVLQILHKGAYLIFFGCGALLSFYKVGLFASLLDKDQFGLYVLVMSSYVYLIYIFSLGANEYLLKVGSLAEMCEEKRKARNIALYHGLLMLILGIILLAPFTLLLETEFQQVYAATALMAICALIFSVLETYFRVEGALLKFSGMMAAKSVLAVLMIFYAGDLQDFNHAIYIEIASVCIVIVVAIVYGILNGHDFSAKLSVRYIKEIISNGYSFCISVMLRNSVTVVDKVFISLFLGAVFLGYYGFVFIIYQAAMLASGVIMSVVGPKILMKMKDKEFAENAQRRILLVSVCIVVAGLLLYPFVNSAYLWGVVNYFEQYNDSVTYSLFLVIYFSAMISFISSILDWFFISLSEERRMLRYAIYSLFVFLFGLVLVLFQGVNVLLVSISFVVCKLFLLMLQLSFIILKAK